MMNAGVVVASDIFVEGTSKEEGVLEMHNDEEVSGSGVSVRPYDKGRRCVVHKVYASAMLKPISMTLTVSEAKELVRLLGEFMGGAGSGSSDSK